MENESAPADDPMNIAGLEKKGRQGDKVVVHALPNLIHLVSLTFLALVLVS